VVALLQSRVCRLPRVRLLVGVLMAVFVLGIGLLMMGIRFSGSTSSSSIVDPRLIIQPTRTHMQSVLSNGIILTGSLSPTIPGKNAVQIVVHSRLTGAQRPVAITLQATMAGMHMIPTRALLTHTVRGYAGTITLPMFGAYHLSVALQLVTGTQRGVIIIKLPLPRL